MASEDLSSDVTMATLAGGIQALQAEFAAMRSRESSIRTELAALRSQEGIQNMSLDERGRERSYRPFQGAPRPHNTKVQYFSNLPGENFLAWRSQFQVIADYHRWSDDEAKQLMYAYMKGTALESVMDIPITGPESAKETLDEYQRRFLPESDSQLLRAQFACVVQLPNESVQKLHARMRVLYHLAYPDASTRNDIFLIERFIAALNNREVQNHVRRRKPLTYAAALAAANEETSFVLMDLATHAPGGVQAPTPGDTSFIAALRAKRSDLNPRRPGNFQTPNQTEKRRCFYCDGEGHIRERCPLRLKDYLRQQTRGGARRSPPPAPSRARPSPRSTLTGPRKVRFAEASNTLPIVGESYGQRRVAAIEEEEHSANGGNEPWDDVDLTTYDEATVAALYQELQEEDDPDFQEGQ